MVIHGWPWLGIETYADLGIPHDIRNSHLLISCNDNHWSFIFGRVEMSNHGDRLRTGLHGAQVADVVDAVERCRVLSCRDSSPCFGARIYHPKMRVSGVSINGGTPKIGCFIMENLIEWMIWGYHPHVKTEGFGCIVSSKPHMVVANSQIQDGAPPSDVNVGL